MVSIHGQLTSVKKIRTDRGKSGSKQMLERSVQRRTITASNHRLGDVAPDDSETSLRRFEKNGKHAIVCKTPIDSFATCSCFRSGLRAGRTEGTRGLFGRK